MKQSDEIGQVVQAICNVMLDVGHVRKTGHNKFHRYSYASEEDLTEALQPAMAKHGLAIVPWACNRWPDAGADVAINVEYLVCHAGSGQWLIAQAVGVGTNTSDKDDKAVYKALTGAYKYVLREVFCIPTGDDPDRDAPQKRTAAVSKSKPAHDDSFTPHERRAFMARLGDRGLKYEGLTRWCEAHGRPRPSAMPPEQRKGLEGWLDEANSKGVTGSMIVLDYLTQGGE